MGTVGGDSKGNPVETLFSGQDVVDWHVPLGSYSVRDLGGMQMLQILCQSTLGRSISIRHGLIDVVLTVFVDRMLNVK